MRLKTVSIQNFRLIADAVIQVPNGLTLVNGENGLGKSSIFQAILWCLYGPDAVGDNQTSLVRQGHRNMEVGVSWTQNMTGYSATRKYSLSPDGKSGRTELTLDRHDPLFGAGQNISGGETIDVFGKNSEQTIAEKQEYFNNLIGPLNVFMATAYVDQHDGPGAFLRSKPAEQRKQLRNLLNISDNWDTWFELAKLKHKSGADRIISNLGRLGAAQEFVDQNRESAVERNTYFADVVVYERKIQDFKFDLKALQIENDQVDVIVVENDRRTKALKDNQTAINFASGFKNTAVFKRDQLAARVESLPDLDEKRRVWVTESDAWDHDNAIYGDEIRDHVKFMNLWNEEDAQLRKDYSDALSVEEKRKEFTKAIEDVDTQLLNLPPETHCPTCAQKLETEDSLKRANTDRQMRVDRKAVLVETLGNLPAPVDIEVIREKGMAHDEQKPEEPEPMDTRPIFAEKAEFDSANTAHSLLAELEKHIPNHEKAVTDLEAARKDLPTPDDYDMIAYAARSTKIVGLNAEIEKAENNKIERQRLLTQAETIIEQVKQRKTEIDELSKTIATDEKLQQDLDVVVTGVGPNGARQLMIDQLLGDFQSEVNEWLHVLLPGFSIFMDTQAESGRETFETLFSTPTGVIGWHGLSGAQRVGVGLSTRLALSRMYAQRAGHRFETWIIDEADGAMRGEKREAFVSMLYKLQESGIDILVVSHAETVVERLEQRIEVIDAGGYTVVTS